MLPDRILNPAPLTYESGALPISLHDPASTGIRRMDSESQRWDFSNIDWQKRHYSLLCFSEWLTTISVMLYKLLKLTLC